MVDRNWLAVSCFVLAMGIGIAQSNAPLAKDAPDITGDWTGMWASYNPAQGSSTAKEMCKRLDCRVEYHNGTWHATFEGDCGRPYKYTIKMEGRQVGKVVLFKGTADLGEKDGGVYDWIGKASDKEFVGFFTSSHYTGVFSLSRPK
ncbi:MAG TPA: hypothetical protein VGK99_10145 [Acidobacteriota bacterium]|jgi:hypothetical protein